MKDVDRRLAELASRQQQVFSRSQAINIGLTPTSLCRRLQSGLLMVCGPQALRFSGSTLDYRGRLMAGLLDLGTDALVSGRAAMLLQLDGFEEGPLEFLVPRVHRGRRTVGVVTSSTEISKLDRIRVDGLACTSGTRTVVQLLGHASEREAGNALDYASRLRLTTPNIVSRRLGELGTQGRAGVLMFERIMESAGVQSWLERHFLALLRCSRLPEPALRACIDGMAPTWPASTSTSIPHR